MIFALAQPLAFAGLALAFVTAIVVRVVAQSSALRLLYCLDRPGGLWLNLRRDVHPLGVIAACFGGTGFGSAGPTLPSRPQRWRGAVVHLAGPICVVLVAQASFAGHALLYSNDISATIYRPSDVLRGMPVTDGSLAPLWFSNAVGMLCFGLIAFLPLPPADGLFLDTVASHQRCGRRFRWGDRQVNQQVGAFILMAVLSVPLGDKPPLHLVLDLIGAPLIQCWSGTLRCRSAS